MLGNWYLLYDGQSTDGRGYTKYLTRTTDKTEKIVSSLNDFK